ncbi:MAG: ubiquinol oxidase subunit II, partial [Mesorhizobium sp.]|nr:ubiquinol oxidase subunit II [Mesorhizobium sp.]
GTDAERVFAFMPATQGAVNWPPMGPSSTALVFDEDLPLVDSSIDRVLMVHSLEHAENPRETLMELWRVLAPGGRLVIVVPNRRGMGIGQIVQCRGAAAEFSPQARYRTATMHGADNATGHQGQRSMRRFGTLLLLPLIGLLSGCDFVVLAPAGDIAAQQRDLLVVSTGLMLIIIIPVMALTVFFAWRYRQSNTSATYAPDWDHSTKLELLIWAAPLLIIICLGALTWLGTHLLDPYRRIDRIEAGQPVTQEHKPIRVEVVALDWKWLFIYPDLGIAAVNELAAPVNQPIDFRITSSAVMNSFYIPALAGQIYAMPGMETKLHAVINRPGTYTGFSANYSGAGFSGMRFAFHGFSPEAFDQWVAQARSGGTTLSRDVYLAL